MNHAKEGHWGPRQQRRQFKRQINQLRHGQSNPDLRLGDCSLIPTTCSYSKMAIHGNFQQFCYPDSNQLVYLQFSILFKAYDLGIQYTNLQTQRYVERLILAILYLIKVHLQYPHPAIFAPEALTNTLEKESMHDQPLHGYGSKSD